MLEPIITIDLGAVTGKAVTQLNLERSWTSSQPETVTIVWPKQPTEIYVSSVDCVARTTQGPVAGLFALRGLGKHAWQDEDAQAYVNRLRDEWDR